MRPTLSLSRAMGEHLKQKLELENGKHTLEQQVTKMEKELETD